MNLTTPENLAVPDHLLTTTRSVRKRLLDFAYRALHQTG